MNHRQRFIAQMGYGAVDRPPLYDFNYWEETIPAWHEQGLPRRCTRRDTGTFFGLDASLGGGEPPDWRTGVNPMLCPAFPEEVLEDDGDLQTIRQNDGVIVRLSKSSRSIPMHLGHTLVDRDAWRKHYVPKLDPEHPDRYPDDWDRRVKIWTDPHRDHPVFMSVGSLFGRIRDWMGLENVAMVPYDDPAWFEEMVETITQCIEAVVEKVLATGARIDAADFWEDMCFNAGPLLAPQHFKQYLVPRYRRITDRLRAHGVETIWVDCDGKIDDLIPHWLEGGVNTMFPLEVGTWGADPVAYRGQYGRDLRMMGGFDKNVLADSPEAIEREVHRLAPLIEEGGYIGFCDHRVPPNVPFQHYLHYARCVREVWGRGVDLPPLGTPETTEVNL